MFRGAVQFLILTVLVALVFAAHYPALRGDFVWDDTALVLRDPFIRSSQLIAEGFQHFLFTDATVSNFYRPLQRLTYTAEYIAFGFNPHAYHFDNVCLHAIAVVGLFLFALAFLELYGVAKRRALLVATLTAAAWAVHPLHSGVVDYVSGRADSLAALFGFAALYFAIRALRENGRTAWPFHALVALPLLASALSKESGLIFGAIYLVLIAIRKRRDTIIAALLALSFVATTYITLRSQTTGAEVPRLGSPAPAVVRPIIAARALTEYTALLIAPANLHMDRDVESHPWGMNDASLTATAWRELETLAGVLLLGALLFWIWRVRTRQPAVFALLLFAGISYLPICGLFPLNATIAEHWIYVPSAFLLLAVTLQISWLLRDTRACYVAITIGVGWIAFLGIRTFQRAWDWKDERTFFQNTIASGGDSARMLINLGTLEMNSSEPDGRNLDRAQQLLARALMKHPEQPLALLNLGAVALKRNDFNSARNFLARAKTHPVTQAQAEEMMAVLENKESGKVDLLQLRLATRTGSPSWSIEQRYITALDEAGRTDAAVEELRAVLATEWYRAESWELLSKYQAKLGRMTEAATALAEARRFDVHSVDR
jgi:protein O-mannosyl-transferase